MLTTSNVPGGGGSGGTLHSERNDITQANTEGTVQKSFLFTNFEVNKNKVTLNNKYLHCMIPVPLELLGQSTSKLIFP